MNNIRRYFEEKIMFSFCPVCGMKNNSCGHLDKKDKVDLNEFSKEEIDRIKEIEKIIDGKRWAIDLKGNVIEVYDDSEESRLISLSVGDKCKNENCKCKGSCKVCKCDKEQLKNVIIHGPLWEKINNLPEFKDVKENLLNLIKHYVDSIRGENVSTIDFYLDFPKIDYSVPRVPTAMFNVKFEDQTYLLNSGITLEQLSDLTRK